MSQLQKASKEEFMNRKDFLKRMGLSGSAIIATYCLGGLMTSCGEDVSPAADVDFTLDLTDSKYASLTTVGGWVKTNNVVIAYVDTDLYVAVTQVCSHEGQKQVTYRSSSEEFYCTAHGARFSLSGKGLNGNGSKGIRVYQTELNGTELHVF
ncbi:ubiquinol-cytochrome c reductase iron-sulfur subunit [Marinoscillum sp.]|uniref:QcrA and Rieske domain-containing protein n=1 Tax=Marinoscillum sp. TaxID=2024838 RepID=UPI003BA86931